MFKFMYNLFIRRKFLMINEAALVLFYFIQLYLTPIHKRSLKLLLLHVLFVIIM